MKRWLWLLVLLCHCTTPKAQTPKQKNDWQQWQLKGCVLKVEERAYQAEGNAQNLIVREDQPAGYLILTFNPQGFITERQEGIFEGFLNAHVYYLYENPKKGKKKIAYILEENTKDTIGTIEYAYNQQNRLIQESVYEKNRILRSRKIYNYDNKGRIQSIYFYNAKGMLTKIQAFTYDNKNRVIEEKILDAEKQPIAFIRKRYKKNRLYKEHQLNKNEQLIQISEYHYDDQGRLKEIQYKDPQGNLKSRRVNLQFDQYGNWTQQQIFSYKEGKEIAGIHYRRKFQYCP